MNIDIDIDVNESICLADFMNVLENLDNLRHNYNLLNNFLKDDWHFHQLLLVGDDRNWIAHHSVHDLKDLFDVVDISHYFFEFLHNHCLLHTSLNLFHSLILVANFNNFLPFVCDLLNLFHVDGDLDNLLSDVLDVSVDIHNLGNDFLHFNDPWDFNCFFFNSLYLIDLWYNYGFFNHFLNNQLSNLDLLYHLFYWDNSVSEYLHFFNLFSDVGYFLYYFLHFCVNHHLLLSFYEFPWLGDNSVLSNDLLEDSWNLNYLFNIVGKRNKLLHNSIYWYWDLNWDNNLSFYFDGLGYFHLIVYDLIHCDFSWNLSNSLYNSLSDGFVVNNHLLSCLKFD